MTYTAQFIEGMEVPMEDATRDAVRDALIADIESWLAQLDVDPLLGC
jgi:hypothetical protein